jgi:hypothetical protein
VWTSSDFLIVVFIVWLVCGAVAAYVGPDGYGVRLFVLTFLFMGPMGIATALIMSAIQDATHHLLHMNSAALKEADATAAHAEAEAEAARARVDKLRRQAKVQKGQSGDT